jgi:hypothetical protein
MQVSCGRFCWSFWLSHASVGGPRESEVTLFAVPACQVRTLDGRDHFSVVRQWSERVINLGVVYT